MNNFEPNYMNIVDAANNIKPERLPLYDHNVDVDFIETYYGEAFGYLIEGEYEDKLEFMRIFTGFFKEMTYDTVSYEICIGAAMPGAGALGGHQPGVIANRQDFEAYPWDSIPDRYFEMFGDRFRALGEMMPHNMKAIGGPGNGIFECVQEVVGYTQLCYIMIDDPKLYEELFEAVGKVFVAIWIRFLKEFGDIYCVCRFGDDLGFKSQTLISHESIRRDVIPQYRKITELVHSYNKSFLLHSCGQIFDVMEDFIEEGGIDAKHSNEDQIAPFSEWVNTYGDRIGNFGGIDMNVLCMKSEEEIKKYVREIIDGSVERGGFAIGSGNSIPNYVPVKGYLAMIEAVNDYRCNV